MYAVLSGRLSVYQLPIIGDEIRLSGPVIQPKKPIRRQLGKLQSVLGKCMAMSRTGHFYCSTKLQNPEIKFARRSAVN